ncbi:MAG TPA: DNA helicase RecQ [Beijerinckiaceae bacterium]|nr:DNA helicase RecQ [Beijerinckiaceae bacterium]
MTALRAAPAPSLAAARALLKSVFGYDAFRPGQEEIVEAVLAGEDLLAVMPTGSGKSLCYQLPALVDGALTVVVSPLIALMRDQVGQLAALGVAAATLNSTSTEDEARDAWRLLGGGALRLLFVSPERLLTEGLASRLRHAGARRLAIDEAHCVSQWGHDFRPEYRQIARARAALGDVQTIAFTATADAATRADVAGRLFSREPRVFLHSFDRPNIRLAFAPKDQPRRQIADFVGRYARDSGIVYCASRQRTESLADNLSRRGFRALPYHAGLDQGVRGRNQDVFLQEDGVVMVATVAFGMGINKPDVRFVCHADMPVSVEGYYQEIGRAGRDGLPADTLTLFGLDDMALRRRQIDEKDIPDERRRVERGKLEAMIALCETPACRRQALLSYFGEASGTCGRCDLCAGTVPLVDATIDAQKILSAVARTGQRFGAGYIADVVAGRETEAIRRNGHTALKTFGVGADRPVPAWRSLVRQLFAAGALAEASAEHGGLRLTEKGEAILFGRETIALRPDAPRRRPREERRAVALAGEDARTEPLFQHLRALRTAIAREQGLPAYMVFPDSTLIAMAKVRPVDLPALRTVPGVGERKLEAYGAAFVKAVSEFLAR